MSQQVNLGNFEGQTVVLPHSHGWRQNFIPTSPASVVLRLEYWKVKAVLGKLLIHTLSLSHQPAPSGLQGISATDVMVLLLVHTQEADSWEPVGVSVLGKSCSACMAR